MRNDHICAKDIKCGGKFVYFLLKECSGRYRGIWVFPIKLYRLVRVCQSGTPLLIYQLNQNNV